MNDSKWKPKAPSPDVIRDLDLTPEEGFVLSRMDGFTSVESLASVTGMKPGEVDRIVKKLTSRGAIPRPAVATIKPGIHAIDPDLTLDDVDPVEETFVAKSVGSLTQADNADLATPLDPAVLAAPSPAELRALQEALVGELDDDDEGDESAFARPPTAIRTNTKSAVALSEQQDAESTQSAIDSEAETMALHQDDIRRAMQDATDPQRSAPEALTEEKSEPPSDDETDATLQDLKLTEGNFRRLYQELYATMERDQRGDLALREGGNALCALCFDPDPGVIRAVLDNSQSGLTHARLIAEHHRNATGLGHLNKKMQLLRDAQVQKFLLRNPQTPEGLYARLLQNKPLPGLYTLTLSREVTQKAKRHIRQAFRKTFARSMPDARASLIFKTEARCLTALVGMGLDSKTAGLLQSRTIQSSLMIQNLARFPGTPPVVIAHLLKQPAARRAAHIKNALLKHPNCPSSAKRSQR